MASGNARFHWATGLASPTTTTVIGATAIPIGQWTHIVGTHDGATGRIYVNGKQRGKTRVTRPLSRSAGPLLIGAAGGRRSFRGVIDEVRIYNRALSRAQVRADRKAAVG